MSTTPTTQSAAKSSGAGLPHSRATAQAGKYLVFLLDGEEFAISVLKVREISKIMEVTPVPKVPAHVKGVINLRGKVIPVVDLRAKLALAAQAYTERTCIIVVEVATAAATAMVGMVVDTVCEVLNIAAGEIEATPEFGGSVDVSCVNGLAKVKGKVKILLDLDTLLSMDSVRSPVAGARHVE